jgi:hypothetical protein
VENRLPRHPGHDLDRRADVDENLMGREEAVEGHAIRGGDRVAPEGGERVGGCRRPPVDAPDWDALRRQRRGEELGTDDDGPEGITEQSALR